MGLILVKYIHMSQKRYLITGGYGLIGSTLVNSLDGEMTILTRSDNHAERIKKEGVKVIKKDLLDISPEDVEGYDVIFHCASTIDNYHIQTNPYLDAEINIKGTTKLLEACKDLEKKPKIVYLSTFFVYGNIYDETKVPITEESRTDPKALYPITKLAAESIIKLYGRYKDIPYLILRLTNVYDENEEYTNKKKGIMNWLIMSAIKGETLPIYKGGDFVRDYIYLEDIIDAIKLILDKNISNDTFLIGTGKSILFRDMIDFILAQTGNKSKVDEIEPPEFHKVVGMTNFVADTSKIKSLGWEAKIDYKEGLQRIIDRYKKIAESS